jgi:ABC-2 type transport system permease protein
MELYLFRHSLRDFLRFRRLWPWLMLCLLSGIIAYTWPSIVGRGNPRQMYADLSSLLVFHLAPLAAAIMVTSIVGQEVEQKTIVYLLTRPISRWKLLLSRYMAACTAVSIVVVLAALALSTVIFGNPLNNDLLKGDVIALILGTFCYGALFLAFSLLVVRSMIPCMLFFVWEVSVPNMPGDIYRLSIFSYMQGIAQHPVADQQKGVAFLTGSLSNNLLMPSTSYPCLIGAIVLLTAGSLWWFSRFEYVPREDAD